MSARVIVTGASGGIGGAATAALRARGARVIGLDLKENAASDVLACDVRDQASVDRAVAEAIERLGGLDVLINNASSLGPVPLALLADTECEAFEEALATNLLGPFRLTRALLGALAAAAREGRGAVVLNVTSDAAINAYPRWGAYGASKAALLQLSRIWDEELAGSGVRVLALDPGDMDTPLHALAVPDADRASLKRPAIAARELADAIEAALQPAPVVAAAA
jgi:NAD(P)-dependent dehydrogenase (short-subunit alcohol dehydrogenase family)